MKSLIIEINTSNSGTHFAPIFLMLLILNFSESKIFSAKFLTFKLPFRCNEIAFLLLTERVLVFTKMKLFTTSL